MNKNVVLTLVSVAGLSLLSHQAQANDGAYYMSGNQLIPMHAVDISVEKERLSIKRVEREEDDDVIEVSVHYELDNQGDAQSMIVGFEALPPGGAAEGFPKEGEHPYMYDFTVEMNGQPIEHSVAYVPYDYNRDQTEAGSANRAVYYYKDGKIQSETEAELRERVKDEYEAAELYVYHFDANFVPGKNVINHTYTFAPSGSVMDLFDFDYVLTAVNRWGNGAIGDFRLDIDMGDWIEFQIPKTFFDHLEDWSIEGAGMSFTAPAYYNYGTEENPVEEAVFFAIRDGKVVFEQQDFTPRGELHIAAPMVLGVSNSDGFDATKDALSFSLSWDVMWLNDYAVAGMSTYSRKVLRNYPFARRGYVFKDPKIQAYYDQLPWYVADADYQPSLDDLSKEEKRLIEQLKAAQ